MSIQREALEAIIAMDPDGLRADDLGRAVRIARAALSAPTAVQPAETQEEADRRGMASMSMPVRSAACRDDGRCQYAIDSGAEGLGHCPAGKCVRPATPTAVKEAGGVDDDFVGLAHEVWAMVQGSDAVESAAARIAQRIRAAQPATPVAPKTLEALTEHHKLDTDRQVFFYEQDFYILSNFSSFNLKWRGLVFPTSEHAYHWEKFRKPRDGESDDDRFQRVNLARYIRENATSAHDAFTTANRWKAYRRADWDDVKVGIMLDILRAKVEQHEYVRRKLLATGDRELIEDSWRDDYWGWGPNRDGQNMLGKLWMQVREELRAAKNNMTLGGSV